VVPPKNILALYILILLYSCKVPNTDNTQTGTTSITQNSYKDSLLNELNVNIRFISDSLLNKKVQLVADLINKYQQDSCVILTYKNSVLKESYEGIKVLGDINNDKIPDTVFVLPPFNFCEEGESYYFSDTNLPRLFTESYCCHPENLFSIGDIDEDGIAEICIFHSSCVSRFKSLRAYTLKNNTWKEIGHVTFDINFMKPDKEKRVKKTGKGKFEMLEIVDDPGTKEWKKFSF
jgi:hypothetical protein